MSGRPASARIEARMEREANEPSSGSAAFLSRSASPQTEEQDYDDDMDLDERTTSSGKPRKTRNAKACLSCRKVKTKCNNSGVTPCQRCADNGLECVFGKSRRGGRQPGAKNLSTLAAQGLLPKSALKNRASAKNANKTARSKTNSKANTPKAVTPTKGSPLMSMPVALSNSQQQREEREQTMESLHRAFPSSASVYDNYMRSTPSVLRDQGQQRQQPHDLLDLNLFSSFGIPMSTNPQLAAITATSQALLTPLSPAPFPSAENGYNQGINDHNHGLNPLDRRKHHDSFSSMSSFGPGDTIDTSILRASECPPSLPTPALQNGGNAARTNFINSAVSLPGDADSGNKSKALKFSVSENRTTVTSLPPSPVQSHSSLQQIRPLRTLPSTYSAQSDLMRLLQLEESHESEEEDDEMDEDALNARFGRKKLDPISLLQSAALMRARRLSSNADDAPPAQSNAVGKGRIDMASGIADASFFNPPRLANLSKRKKFIASELQPEILTMISLEDVTTLFDHYYECLHGHFPILSPAFHNAERVTQRSPFLLTVVCAVAAHFHEKYAGMARPLALIAKRLCFETASRGFKTTEIVQAGVLLTIWQTLSPHRWEEDTTNLQLGLAKSSATDIGLHRINTSALAQSRPPSASSASSSASASNSGKHSFEADNRTRTYLLTFLRDREFAVLLGRSTSMKETAAVNKAEICLPNPLTLNDLWICMMLELYRIVCRTLSAFEPESDTETDSNLPKCDFMALSTQFEQELARWSQHFTHAVQTLVGATERDIRCFMTRMTFSHHFAVLNIFSFGLADSLERQPQDVAHFFNKCLAAASSVLRIANQCLNEDPIFKYAPDSFYVELSYAAVSLLRFCRPRLESLHDATDAILALITETADTLGRIAMAPTHMAGQYSVFLRNLIAAHYAGPFMSTVPTPRAMSPAFGNSNSVSHMASTAVPEAEYSEHFESAFADFGGDGKLVYSPPSDPTGMDQMLPSQWSMLDQRFDTIYSLKASDTWNNSVLMPGFSPAF